MLQVPKEQREDLRAVLDALEAEGKIFVSAKGKYTKGQAKRLTGTFQAHARGFGFVIPGGGDGRCFHSGRADLRRISGR